MLDPLLRSVKDRLFDPLARRVGPGVSPGAVTVLGAAVGVAAAAAAAAGRLGWGLALWLANRALDALDGSLARVHDRQSDWGGYLDLVLDFVVYALIPIGLVLGRPAEPAWLALAALLAAFYVNAASWMILSALLEKRQQGARARGEQTSVTMPTGLIGGTETMVLYALFFLFPERLVPLMIAMAALVAATAAQRVRWARPALRLLPLLVLLFPIALRAQEATLAGIVRGQEGHALAGARVAFAPGDRATTTDTAGLFALAVPAGVEGALSVARAGYLDERRPIAPVASGERRELTVLLSILYVQDAITVVTPRPRPLLDPIGAAAGGAVERAELEALPTDARDPLTLAFTVPGVAQATGFFGDAPPLTIHGGNALYTRYTIDGLDDHEGFLGGPRVELPLSAVERLAVRTTGYGVALGRSPNGVVDLVTRAGGPQWTGEAFVYGRPGVPFDADPHFTPPGVDPDGFRRIQAGGAAGGPLSPGRTFVFGALELGDEREDRIGSTARTDFLGTEVRETAKAFARLDHGWSSTQTTTLRVAASAERREGQGGGVIVPEADITTRRIGSLTALTHRSAWREGRAANEVTLQLGTFDWDFPPSRSDLRTPQVTIVAPDSVTVEAVVGSSNFVFDERELQLQLRDVLEARLGERHAVTLGVDLTRSRFELDGSGTNPVGAYTVIDEGNVTPSSRFVSIDDVPADVRVLRLTIDANPQEVDLTQTLIGAFVEDVWRVSPTLTLALGLRWDYDDITSRGESEPDLDNLQPRLAATWAVRPHTVLRGGAGIYTGALPYAVYSDAVQFGPGGSAVVTFEGAAFPPPAFGEAPTAAELRAALDGLPPREVRRTFARGLEQPWSLQTIAGWQRELSPAWGISVEGIWVETRDLPRSWDLNAITRPIGPADSIQRPAEFGDAFRPVAPAAGSFRRLTTTDSGGRARYLALVSTLRRRVTERLGLEATWVWSRARTDTEDINFNAAQANDFDAEWADAVNDRRHKVTVRGFYTLFEGLRLAAIADFQTGTPINRVAFFRDLDGSGPIFGNGFVGNHDRFFGVPRNAERLPSELVLRASATGQLPLGGHGLELRADVFNLLNAEVVSGFANGIPGGGPRTQVGRPGDPIELRAGGPSRQIQLSARWMF